MDFADWLKETHAAARPALEAALAADARGDRAMCARHAQQAAVIYLQRYLAVGGPYADSECVADLLEEAIRRDGFFARLRREAARLDRGVEGEMTADDLVDALKEIRLLSQRAGFALGLVVEMENADPILKQFVVHSTTEERASSIFVEGALYSFNECVRRGLLSGEAVGVKHLLDPRRCLDYVLFHVAENRYFAGEKVANSQRKGFIDEALTDDYQPSVRLFFRRAQIEALPAFATDGMHWHMVRDRVSLDLLAWAVFPTAQARATTLDAVPEEARRAALAAKSLLAPPGCGGEAERYVKETNEMVRRAEEGGPLRARHGTT